LDTGEILSHIDHTLLTQTATWEEIRRLCEEGIQYKTASVCIPPSYVERAALYTGGRIAVCTVIGFPNGYSTTEVKCFEASQAVRQGAGEIDMVINLGMVKEKVFSEIEAEIRSIRSSCAGKILKVIVETCLLTEAEKIELCKVVSRSGADYIKTSTGFSTAGATREDVALFAAYLVPSVKIKAAGGIRTLRDAEDFIRLGAARLGSSSLVKQMEAEAKRTD